MLNGKSIMQKKLTPTDKVRIERERERERVILVGR